MISAYFAYGSNMNPDRVGERGLNWRAHEAATLSGCALRFNKVAAQHPGQAHANVVVAPEAVVEGVIYHFEDPNEILKMDPFERAGVNYGREGVVVATAGGAVWAWTYFANPGVMREGLSPSREYLNHLLAGREYLSDAYFESLKNVPVAPE